MSISNKEILDKTHYGLDIYAHILRKYYPDETVLYLSGKTCKPTKNPFNNDKNTLMISIIDNLAQHIDADNSIPFGDAFLFAQQHYECEGNELNEILNRELHLNIKIEKEQGEVYEFIDISKIPSKPKIIVPRCSYFQKPITNTFPLQTLSLVEIYHKIKEPLYQSTTTALRSIADKNEARRFKASQFDYVTFSGIFSQRNDKNLRVHSGLLTIDFDHISGINELKASLLEDQFFETELLFISPSGDGLKWVIPIDITKTKHQSYFTAVSNYIFKEYKLNIDQSGKDISRACFLPYDADVYINPNYLQ